MADLAGSTTTDDLGNVPIRRDLTWRYLLDDAQDEFGIVVIHRAHQFPVPGPPLNGPITFDVIHPP